MIFSAVDSQEFSPPPIYNQADSVVQVMQNKAVNDSILTRAKTDNVIYTKNFDDNFSSKYKNAEFDYTTIKPQESLWEKIKRRFAKILESIFGNIDPLKSSEYTEIILRIFGVIIIGFVLYFLNKFLLNKNGNFFFAKKNQKIISNQDLHENIHEINFTQTIENFERQKDFRSAVRYQFLNTLKKLADKKLILWNPEKTNQDYLVELKSAELKADFENLAYIFDYVWYGEFDISENNYTHFQQKFLNFKA